MRWLAVLFVLPLAGCLSTGPTSTEIMQGDIGKPIAFPIIRNGLPETIVRLSPTRVAYTFLKQSSGVTGGAGDPIRTYHVECRFTLVVDAPRDGMGESEMMVVDYVPPKAGCD